MTDKGPGGAPRRFTPGELDDVSGMQPDDLASEMRVARELEGLAARADAAPSASFADRVMDAVAAEPSPAPVRAAGRAIRRVALGALLVSIRDAWRVTVRPGFPMAVRGQAFALVLVVALVGTASAAATAGAIGLLGADRPTPTPDATIQTPSTTESPSVETPSQESPSLESVLPSPSESVEPTGSADEESASPEETGDPGESADDHGGDSGSGSGSGSGSSSGSSSDSKDGTRTAEPDDHSGSSGSDDSKSGAPRPTETPKPGETPKAEDD